MIANNNNNNTHSGIMANDFDTIVVAYQATRSFRVLFIATVRPPLHHIAQLVVQPTGVVIVMRKFVPNCTTCGSVI